MYKAKLIVNMIELLFDNDKRMIAKFEQLGIPDFYQALGQKINFHSQIVDWDPQIPEHMYTRSKLLSRQYFSEVVGLNKDIEYLKFDFFNEGIRAGKKLSYSELKQISAPFDREAM